MLHMQFKDVFNVFNKPRADLDWTVSLNKTMVEEQLRVCMSVILCVWA